jgi:hypothetical protein
MMASPEAIELRGYLVNLINATREGTIQWRSVNPTTFVYETGTEEKGARLTLQRLERTVRTVVGGRIVANKSFSYLLQAHEVIGGRMTLKVNIDGDDDDDANERLSSLFDIVKSGLSRKGLDFLKEILPH